MYPTSYISIIKNTTTGTYHPIMYREAPMPGPPPEKLTFLRFKSSGHHTSGFQTREEAVKSAQENIPHMKQHLSAIVYSQLEQDEFEWDGNSLPSSVILKSVSELKQA